MSPRSDLLKKYCWQHQPDAELNQPAPNINQWYTVLAPTEDVRIISFAVAVFTLAEDLEFRIIADGAPLLGAFPNATAATWFEAINAIFIANTLNPSFVPLGEYRSFLLEGHNVAVEVRKTSANGAGILSSIVKWARLLPT